MSVSLLLEKARAAQYATNGSKDIVEIVAWEKLRSVWLLIVQFLKILHCQYPADLTSEGEYILVFILFILFLEDFCFLHKSIHSVWFI